MGGFPFSQMKHGFTSRNRMTGYVLSAKDLKPSNIMREMLSLITFPRKSRLIRFTMFILVFTNPIQNCWASVVVASHGRTLERF